MLSESEPARPAELKALDSCGRLSSEAQSSGSLSPPPLPI